MLIILSPSKGQDFETQTPTRLYSQPVALKDSKVLIKELSKLTATDIQELMGVSDNIANLNLNRIKHFVTPFTPANAKQAIYAFKGDVYSGINVNCYSEDDLTYAQNHLRILSGLYGCLRPLDLIQPYRLEMKTRLHTPKGDTLYQFWGEKITQELNTALAEQQHPLLINLASTEYFKAVKPKLLDGKLLTINFKETKEDKTRVVAIFAKRARGMMADFIIRNRIEQPEGLKDFTTGGYKFNNKLSDNQQWTFTRTQP